MMKLLCNSISEQICKMKLKIFVHFTSNWKESHESFKFDENHNYAKLFIPTQRWFTYVNFKFKSNSIKSKNSRSRIEILFDLVPLVLGSELLLIAPKSAIFRGKSVFHVKIYEILDNELIHHHAWNDLELLVFLKRRLFAE